MSGFAAIKEKRRERAKLAEQARAILDKARKEERDLTAAESERFDSIHDDVAKLQGEIDRLERQSNVELDGAGPAASPSAEALEADREGRLRPLEPEERAVDFVRRRHPGAEAFGGLSLGRYLRASALGAATEAERRALAAGSDSAGGFTVPTILSAQLIDLLRPQAHVLAAGARLVPIDSDKHRFAKLASDPSPTFRAENDPVPESDPTFSSVLFEPKTAAFVVKAPIELLEDSVNLEQELPRIFAAAMANALDRVALVGDSAAGEPVGIANMTGVSEVSMGTNGGAITDFTPLLDLQETIAAANGPEPTDAIMAPRTGRAFAGLEDTTGQPLRRPDALEELTFRVTSQVPIDQTQGTAVDASSVYVGNFDRLWIGFRLGLVRILRLQERFADNAQVGWLVMGRWDVQASHPAALGRLVGIVP